MTVVLSQRMASPRRSAVYRKRKSKDSYPEQQVRRTAFPKASCILVGVTGAHDQVERSGKQPQPHIAICRGQNPKEQKLNLLLIVLTRYHRPVPDLPFDARSYSPDSASSNTGLGH